MAFAAYSVALPSKPSAETIASPRYASPFDGSFASASRKRSAAWGLLKRSCSSIPQRTLYIALLFAGCVAKRNCSFACCHSSRPQKPSARVYASPLRVNPSKHPRASCQCPCLRSDQQSAGTAADATAQAADIDKNAREITMRLICPDPPAPSPTPKALPSTAFYTPRDPSPLSVTSACRCSVPGPPSSQAMPVSLDRSPPAGWCQDAAA